MAFHFWVLMLGLSHLRIDTIKAMIIIIINPPPPSSFFFFSTSCNKKKNIIIVQQDRDYYVCEKGSL